MLFDSTRHEPLNDIAWDEGTAVRTIERIVRDAEQRFSPQTHWPLAPLDADGGKLDPVFDLYFGASGVVWALQYLHAVGAVELQHSYGAYVDTLLPLNRARLKADGATDADLASFLVGDTGILLLGYWLHPTTAKAARIEQLIAGNVEHPARELMWGAPGTLLAALFLHKWTREPRWAELYRSTARKLRSELVWSPDYRCHYWIQELYGHRSTYLDAVHGFVATAAVVLKGWHLLDSFEQNAWQQCIADTIRHTAVRDGDQANWPPFLHSPDGIGRRQKLLMQFCHGAPGFVTCLSDAPTTDLDDLLLAGGRAVWAAGPLAKGSNLCHGTGGNGYAFLKLFERTRDERWLARARAFAMHGIAQTEAHEQKYGQMRYSLWTGDLGFAIYLWDCIRGAGAFPTLDVFFVREE